MPPPPRPDPRPAWDLRRTFWPALAALVGIFLLFEFTPLDLLFQDRLYDDARGTWLIDKRAPLLRLLFYTGPKALLILFGVSILVWILGPARWRATAAPWARDRRAWWVVVLTLGLVPLAIGQLKATTNIFTPAQITRYGGTMPHTRVLARYDNTTRPATRGRGWPAGHASGGFALLSLAGLARTRRGRLIGVSTGLAIGLIMGLYQTAKGDHFLSHTLLTALLAWLTFLALHRLLLPPRPNSLVSLNR